VPVPEQIIKWDDRLERAAVNAALGLRGAPSAVVSALKDALEWVLDRGAASEKQANSAKRLRSAVSVQLRLKDAPRKTAIRAYARWKPVFEAELRRGEAARAAKTPKPRPTGIDWDPHLTERAFDALQNLHLEQTPKWDELKQSVYRAKGMGGQEP
jgi:Arc/MetJ family transcription regulator